MLLTLYLYAVIALKVKKTDKEQKEREEKSLNILLYKKKESTKQKVHSGKGCAGNKGQKKLPDIQKTNNKVRKQRPCLSVITLNAVKEIGKNI